MKVRIYNELCCGMDGIFAGLPHEGDFLRGSIPDSVYPLDHLGGGSLESMVGGQQDGSFIQVVVNPSMVPGGSLSIDEAAKLLALDRVRNRKRSSNPPPELTQDSLSSYVSNLLYALGNQMIETLPLEGFAVRTEEVPGSSDTYVTLNLILENGNDAYSIGVVAAFDSTGLNATAVIDPLLYPQVLDIARKKAQGLKADAELALRGDDDCFYGAIAEHALELYQLSGAIPTDAGIVAEYVPPGSQSRVVAEVEKPANDNRPTVIARPGARRRAVR